MKTIKFKAGCCALLCSMGSALAKDFDNRFLPWHPSPVIRTLEKRSSCKVESFFLTAERAYGDAATEKKGIYEVWGVFDQKILSEASVAVGNVNPLQVAWQAAQAIKWNVHGKIQGQGISFSGEFMLHKYLSAGFVTRFLHLTSNQKFILPRDTARSADLNLTDAQEKEIDEDRRTTLKDLGFAASNWSDTGFADSALYLRWSWSKDYIAKCRFVDWGFVGGVLLPSGKQRDISNPASVPFGGENMKGFFVGIDSNIELKEDLWFSCMLQISKRLKKTQTRRLPVKGEPEIFGATTGLVRINPGVTVLFSPTLTFANLQDGFGAQLQYCYTVHSGDVWTDQRPVGGVAIDFSNSYKVSKWKSEYLVCNLFYDFGASVKHRSVDSVVSFSWDIPIKVLKPQDVAKTHKIGLSLALHF